MGKIKLLEWMRNENGEANLGMASGNKTELDQRERERERETLRKKSNGQNSLKVDDKRNIKKTKF